MVEAETTRRMATELGVTVEPSHVERLFSCFAPALTEWSVNAAEDARGTLRVVLYHPDRELVAKALRSLDQHRCAALQDALPRGDMDGVGLSLGAGRPPAARYYRLADLDDGTELAEAAMRLFPALHARMDPLVDVCGPHDCTAVGFEVSAGGRERATLYCRVANAARATQLLERVGHPKHPQATAFFDELLGIGSDDAERIWPKVWVARSSDGADWKFYYFARRDPFRPTDEELLDLAGAGPAARAAWQASRELPAVASKTPSGHVQLLALRLPEVAAEGAPRFTIYLAPA